MKSIRHLPWKEVFREQRLASKLALMICISYCAGCGGSSDSVARVSGKITVGGQPLKNAKLEFTPQGTGRLSVGYSDAQGNYELQYNLQEKGALIGKHTVNIRQYPEPGTSPVNIPGEFQGQEVEVVAGKNEFNFEIP